MGDEAPEEAPSEGLTLPNVVSTASQRFTAGPSTVHAVRSECAYCNTGFRFGYPHRTLGGPYEQYDLGSHQPRSGH